MLRMASASAGLMLGTRSQLVLQSLPPMIVRQKVHLVGPCLTRSSARRKIARGRSRSITCRYEIPHGWGIPMGGRPKPVKSGFSKE